MDLVCLVAIKIVNISGKIINLHFVNKTETTMNLVRKVRRTLVAAVIVPVVGLAVSCTEDEDFTLPQQPGVEAFQPGNRLPHQETRRVLLMYECGYNSLSTYLQGDIDELKSGVLPGKARTSDVVLVFSKLRSRDGICSLTRLSADADGQALADTLLTYDKRTVATSPETLSRVLNYVRQNFPAAGYGMIFSSHASGWMPTGYYASNTRSRQPGLVFYFDRESFDPAMPVTRSLGQDYFSAGERYEMTVNEFASAIPFKLDYILFDCCLTGSVEVAYGLKDKADYLGLSPAEVLADGMFDYTKITGYLFAKGQTDLVSLFRDSYLRYESRSGFFQSSTVSLVKTSGLDALAQVCKPLFEKYRSAIAALDPAAVQNFGGNKRWFFDLRDVLSRAGATPDELLALDGAVADCLAYKNNTRKYYSAHGGLFDIAVNCGLTTYIPSSGTNVLNAAYPELDWNRATDFIK